MELAKLGETNTFHIIVDFVLSQLGLRLFAHSFAARRKDISKGTTKKFASLSPTKKCELQIVLTSYLTIYFFNDCQVIS